MLAAMPHPALLTGPRHEICAFNRLARTTLRLAEDAIGTALLDVLSSRIREAGPRLTDLAACLDDRDTESLLPLRLEVDGGVLACTWAVLSVESGGASFRLHRLYLRPEETVNHARLDFLGNVSHELRTPLSALALTLEAMLQDFDAIPPDEFLRMITLLHRNTRRLESLVSNLIDAAALQNGRLHLRRTQTSAHQLIRDASELMQSLLAAKNQRLDMRLIGRVPALNVDPKRITGVLVNLLANASRYGLPDEPIQLMVIGERGRVRFTVRQRGPGVPPHEQALVFERFYRSSNGFAVRDGSGLGLAIVKEIVEMHGGSVGLKSQPGKTTAFWFTIPVKGTSP